MSTETTDFADLITPEECSAAADDAELDLKPLERKRRAVNTFRLLGSILAAIPTAQARLDALRQAQRDAEAELDGTKGLIARARKQAEDAIHGGQDRRLEIISAAGEEANAAVADLNKQIATKKAELAALSERADQARKLMGAK